MKKFKSVMAFLAVILIFAAVIAFFVSAVTGNKYFMGYLYIAWIIPVLLWIFMRIADILGKYGPGTRDSYQVLQIEPDFDIEDGQKRKTSLYKVKLKHRKTGEEQILEVPWQNLEEEGIVVGDVVKETQNVLLKIAEKSSL